MYFLSEQGESGLWEKVKRTTTSGRDGNRMEKAGEQTVEVEAGSDSKKAN
jgi:hypothetical protein